MAESFVKDLKSNTRTKMIDLLNARLADGIDLHAAVKQAHWNIKGPSFIAVHELLDEVADRMLSHVDAIAERCVILGGMAHGTTQAVGKATTLKPYPLDEQNQKAHVEDVKERLMDFGSKIRKAIDEADESGDKDTADLFTGISRAVDKDAWFIGAHNA